ncbi:MAG: NB-ARC domain-containing protein, partial [Chloroflexi bacterium]|nr:NB-ARC domain-containing protein [Chloroflexota bacterium]
MTPQLNVYSLGELRISLDDQPISFGSNKASALLIYLLGTGRSQPREVLAELLYEGYPQKDAMSNFRRELSVVRTALPDVIDSSRDFVWLNAEATIWFDFAELEASLISIPEYLTTETALEIQQQISELFVGDFLEGFPDIGSAAFEQWVLAERDRLKRRVQNGRLALANYFIQHGHYDAGLETTEALLKLDELDEEAYLLQMIALAQSGQRHNAIRTFQNLSKVLEEEHGLEPDAGAVEIYERIRAGESLDDYFPEPEAVGGYESASDQIPNNLPRQLTPFVGRSKEIEQFLNIMTPSNPRLITIEGSGGIGKTRFALKVAEHLMPQFSHGVYFVPLADLGSPEQIVPTIVESMDIDLYGDKRPEIELSEYIADKKILLLLDNFEDVADGAEIVADILAQTAELTIFITSRERLRLRGETSFPLDGLHYPRSDEDAHDILEIDSGRLFLQSARRVDPGFEALSEDLLPITRICRIVRGMPLAIELATSYITMLTPADILDELNRNGIDMLVTDDFNIPDRQKSIVAIFDWSWKRLSASEQEALIKLSLFRGGFTRDAAQVVAGAGLRMLNILLSMSLIYREGRSRYEIHELMGQFLHMKLAENGELLSDIHQ